MTMRIRFSRWRDVDKTNTPLSQLFEDFLLAKRSSGCSAKTVSWYRDNLCSYRKFVEAGQSAELRDFTAESVRRYTVHLQERRIKYDGNKLRRVTGEALSSHTIFGHVATLKAFAGWLASEGYTEDNVLKGVPQPKKRQTVINALSQDEIQKLISGVPKHTAMGTRDRAILITFLDTGLRASELCDLQLRDVHMDESYLKVLGKGDKERIVPIGASATRALLRYKEFFRPEPVRPGIENLFLSVHGEEMTPSSLREMVRRWAKKAGIKTINVHKLRHSFALQYLLAGGDAFSLQKILGHTTMEMTRNYVNMLSDHLIEQHRLHSPMDRLRSSVPPGKKRADGRDEFGQFGVPRRKAVRNRRQLRSVGR